MEERCSYNPEEVVEVVSTFNSVIDGGRLVKRLILEYGLTDPITQHNASGTLRSLELYESEIPKNVRDILVGIDGQDISGLDIEKVRDICRKVLFFSKP